MQPRTGNTAIVIELNPFVLRFECQVVLKRIEKAVESNSWQAPIRPVIDCDGKIQSLVILPQYRGLPGFGALAQADVSFQVFDIFVTGAREVKIVKK